MPVKIHPTAVIHPDAQLDVDVEIGPYVVIGEDVRIGAGTYVGPHSVIEFSQIGKGNHFTASAFIGTPPQDFNYHGEKTRLVIGDNTVIREGVSLHRGSVSTGLTKIGSNCMFMANSHVGHDSRVGDGVVMTNSSAASGHVEIGDKAVISGLVGIHQFVRIGSLTMISGGAMVVLDIPPYCTAQGDRAELVGLNLVGLRRAGMSRDDIRSIKQAYKTLFMSGIGLKDAAARLKSMNLSPQTLYMVEFCENSRRGITRPRMVRETEPPPSPGVTGVTPP